MYLTTRKVYRSKSIYDYENGKIFHCFAVVFCSNGNIGIGLLTSISWGPGKFLWDPFRHHLKLKLCTSKQQSMRSMTCRHARTRSLLLGHSISWQSQSHYLLFQTVQFGCLQSLRVIHMPDAGYIVWWGSSLYFLQNCN